MGLGTVATEDLRERYKEVDDDDDDEEHHIDAVGAAE